MIKSRKELQKFDFNVLPNSFVLKPNSGYGGEGIIPIKDYQNDLYLTSYGKSYSESELYDHILDILDGRYSIAGMRDSAFFEQLIIPEETLGKYSIGGLPDIRVVVHNLIPVMAMLRLPTLKSNGKANLHQGAIGCGIDLGSGQITHLIQHGRLIDDIPDVPEFEPFSIPHWDNILLFSSKIQLITNIGYLATDFAIDKFHGPVLLELNARAGLTVQIANLASLKKRLEKVRGIKVSSPEHGIRIAKELFSQKISKKSHPISGKPVIGSEESVDLILKDEIHRLKAQINLAHDRTVIDRAFAISLNLNQNINETHQNNSNSLLSTQENQQTIRIKIGIGGKRINTVATISDLGKYRNYKIILGKRDLTNFLIDPSLKKDKITLPKTSAISKTVRREIDCNYLDLTLKKINRLLKLLYFLRPLNLIEEKQKFLHNQSYNPIFTYPAINFNPYQLKAELNGLKIDETPLGLLFREKILELINKTDLILSIGTPDFTEKSIHLFHYPEASDIYYIRRKLNQHHVFNPKNKLDSMDVRTAKKNLEDTLETYHLSDWQIVIQDDLVSNCIVGKKNRIFLRNGSRFSQARINALIVHEIETHVLSSENGKKQPYQIFNYGCAGYLTTQEGLAMHNVETRLGLNTRFLILQDALYTALHGSFAQVFKKIHSYGLEDEDAFHMALKVKRGLIDTSQDGAFTKDYLYYSGYNQIKSYIKAGGDLKKLYLGKINSSDLSLIDQIIGIVPPTYLPHWVN